MRTQMETRTHSNITLHYLFVCLCVCFLCAGMQDLGDDTRGGGRGSCLFLRNLETDTRTNPAPLILKLNLNKYSNPKP